MRSQKIRLAALALLLLTTLSFSAGCEWGNVNLGIVIPLGITSETGLFSFLRSGSTQVITGNGGSSTPLPTPPEVPGTTTTTGGGTGGTTA